MSMTLQQAITGRRTIRQFVDKPIEENVLYRLLEQAAFAPFHNKTEPWHVKIIDQVDDKMNVLDEIFKSMHRDGSLKGISKEKLIKIREGYEQALVKPAITLIISADQYKDPKEDLEAVAATSAFIQNLQLLAWEEGIGIVWRTNPFIFDPLFQKKIGLAENQKMIGILQVGYFSTDKTPKVKTRRELETWVTKGLE